MYVVVVLVILTQLAPVLLCQNEMVPVWPLNVNAPGELPEQTALVPLKVPATGAGLTVINEAAELASAQVPL